MSWFKRRHQVDPDMPSPEVQAIMKRMLEHETGGPALVHWLAARKMPWYATLDPDCPSVIAAKSAAPSEGFNEIELWLQRFAKQHALSGCERCHAHMLRVAQPNPYPCASGRSASFGGRWTIPCSTPSRHAITSPSAEPILLCDLHFDELARAGLVEDQNIGAAEYVRREAARLDK